MSPGKLHAALVSPDVSKQNHEDYTMLPDNNSTWNRHVPTDSITAAFKDVARLIASLPTNEQKSWRDELDKAMDANDQLSALERLTARIVLPTPQETIARVDKTLADSEAARRAYWEHVDEHERRFGYRLNTQPTPEKFRTPVQETK